MLSETKIKRLLNNYIEKETSFRFQKFLGKGSYGIAYVLVHKETGEQYVLKRMKSKFKKKKQSILKFKQEIEMLKLLDFPNIPNVILEGEIEGIPFYIMDLIDGHTFEQEIFQEGKSFSLEESFTILKKLLDVVIKIHDKKIVHRDLRTPNILIKNETIYIIDFGLASYITENAFIEKINNPKKLEDPRSDLYFIGHFLLFLIYSNYSPTSRKERSWQEELKLPKEVQNYIERLLLIGPAFSSAKEALQSIPTFIIRA
ncbi:protein kinase domain-containing protein [Ureibacillus manganicus]|uniref:Serine/threonine protein kinase n=1 Tax=Ureibacillus manganicus DSM 26584 TaxID=1384049 RepID=A0A0A3I3M3_9BACL|nr:protein kinase [Ureibacillus manganicus]KGR79299.1 serine/threonine protein kinase [Ureibacillus manganicus DSM 26584]